MFAVIASYVLFYENHLGRWVFFASVIFLTDAVIRTIFRWSMKGMAFEMGVLAALFASAGFEKMIIVS